MTRTPSNPARFALPAIVLLAVAIRLTLALTTPAWQNADEYPHYWVAEQIARDGRLPLSEPVHPRYEAFQAPLHYLALATLKWALWPETTPRFTYEPSPLFMELAVYRLFTVLLGLLVLAAAWRALSSPASGLDRWQALGALTFLALLPTFAGVSSAVNNDAAVILCSTLALAAALDGRMRSTGTWLALAVLSKVNAVFLAAPIALLEAIRWADQARGGGVAGWDARLLWRRLWPVATGLAVAAAILAARNLWLYDELQGVNPGAPRDFRLDPAVAAWALRNLFWSFWYAFGRLYEQQLPVTGYLALAASLALLTGRGAWVRWRAHVAGAGEGGDSGNAGNARVAASPPVAGAAGREGEDSGNAGAAGGGPWPAWIGWLARHPLQTLFLAGVPVYVLASLVYTLSYPFGTMTSWGKNLYPLLLPIAGTLAWVVAADRTGRRLFAAGCAGLLALCVAAFP